jgi:3-phenylpropionate/cinnamic acid dioxygenase small subunit
MADGVREVKNLLYTYAERIDAGEFEGIAALFTYGRIQAAADAPPEATFEGPDAVLAMYEGATRRHADGTPRTKHVTTNAIVEVDEAAGTASSRSHYLVTQATEDLPLQIIITGHYHDTFRRIDGVWWFDTRVMFVDQVGDLSHHLSIDI